MTIGELVKAKMFKARAVAFGCWLLFAASIFLDVPDTYRALSFIPFTGFMGSIVFIIFFVTCPKCDARLGQVMSSIKKPKFCPSCGTSFDSRA